MSREADAWMRKAEIEGVALPLYQGVMMNRLQFSVKRWLSGTGLSAKWEVAEHAASPVGPQFLMAAADATGAVAGQRKGKLAFRDIARSTDERTMIPALLPAFPCGNVLGVLNTERFPAALAALSASLVFDWSLRRRIGGTHLNWFVVEELAVPQLNDRDATELGDLALRLSGCSPLFATSWRHVDKPWRSQWGVSVSERKRLLAVIDAVSSLHFGVSLDEFLACIAGCDLPAGEIAGESSMDPRGFWRVDHEVEPELRQTVLAAVALSDLAPSGGASLPASWQLPEALRLEDYGLGAGVRSEHRQPVASRLGSRYIDWQWAQGVEESWRECEIHAANLASSPMPQETS